MDRFPRDRFTWFCDEAGDAEGVKVRHIPPTPITPPIVVAGIDKIPNFSNLLGVSRAKHTG